MSYKIITHNGKSHMDELMGISLLAIHLGEIPEEIIRIHPDIAAKMVQEENLNKDLYYVDCGLKFDPDNNIFDHHHSNELGCAALLIFNHFFKDLEGTKVDDYIKLVSLVDTKGPNSLDDFKYKSDSLLYFSFPQKIILKEFENQPILITSIFYNGIKSMIEFEHDKQKAAEWLSNSENITISEIDHVQILIYNNPPPIEIASAVKSVDGDIVDENNIHVIYSFDKDDKSVRTLFRTLKADNVVDFSKANVSNPLFCHKGGFLLKFMPKDENEWKKIIKESIQ